MNKKKLVSIIIPCFNRASTISRCLDSVFYQTHQNYEVIVIDDGSTDNSKKIINKYSQKLPLKYVYLENSGGPAKPRNVGISLSSGEIIALLDSDDWWLPQKLEFCIEYINQGNDLVCHNMYIWDKNKSFSRKILSTREFKYPVKKDLIMNGNNIINSSVVFKKSLIKNDNKLFDEDKRLVASEDYDAWIKISEITDKFFFINSELGYYSTQEESITNDLNNYINNHYIFEKYKNHALNNFGMYPQQLLINQIKKTVKLGFFKESFAWLLLYLKIKSKKPRSKIYERFQL